MKGYRLTLEQHIFTKNGSETFYSHLDHHKPTVTLTSFKAENKI